MKHQFSFGIVPLKKRGNHWDALLVKRKEGFWEFPKGHAEQNEQPIEAASRELEEETGLQIKKILIPDPITIEYKFTFNNQLIDKKVFYFVAEVSGEIVLQPGETIDSLWVPLEKAQDHVTFSNSKELCQKVIQQLMD